MRLTLHLPSLMILCVPMAFAAPLALAQTPPPTVDPSRIAAPAPLPSLRDPDLGALRVVLPEEKTRPSHAEKMRFRLHGVSLEGLSVYTAADFDDLIAPIRDKEISLGEVYDLTQAITQRYRENGYLLTRVVVPPQDVTDGALHLQVIEGEISQYIIETDSESVRQALIPLAEKLVATKPLTSAAIERYLLLMNDLPGLTVKSVLAPAPDQPGAAVITLMASRKRTGGAVGVDTYGNAYLGPERINANLLVNGVIDARDSLALSTLVAPDHTELAYGAIAYSRALGAEGTVLGFSASKARTKPSLPPALGGLLVPVGDATDVNLTAQYPILRSRRLSISLDGALEASRNATDYAPGLGSLETRDDQRVIGGGTTASLADAWHGFNQLQLGFRKGLDIADASQKGDAALSRPTGDPQFFKLVGEASRYQALFGPFSLLGATQGQWTENSLLASEQFGVGGSRYGRGFDSSEITGDRGFAAKAELIWQPPLAQYFGPLPAPGGAELLSDLQLYAFYDGGMVWSIEPAIGQPAHNTLTSTGVGSRFTLLDRLAGDVFFAVPLTNHVASRALDKQEDWRMQFSLRATLW